jgi:hypothetical protein
MGASNSTNKDKPSYDCHLLRIYSDGGINSTPVTNAEEMFSVEFLTQELLEHGRLPSEGAMRFSASLQTYTFSNSADRTTTMLMCTAVAQSSAIGIATERHYVLCDTAVREYEPSNEEIEMMKNGREWDVVEQQRKERLTTRKRKLVESCSDSHHFDDNGECVKCCAKADCQVCTRPLDVESIGVKEQCSECHDPFICDECVRECVSCGMPICVSCMSLESKWHPGHRGKCSKRKIHEWLQSLKEPSSSSSSGPPTPVIDAIVDSEDKLVEEPLSL